MEAPDPLEVPDPSPEPTPAGPCPVCGTTLIRHELKGLSLQLCNEHGHWLPEGALEEVVRRIQQETVEATQSRRRRKRRSLRHKRERQRAKQSSTLSSALLALLGVIKLP